MLHVEDIKNFNECLLNAMTAWMQKNNIGPGEDNYYWYKINKKEILDANDIGIIEHIASNYDPVHTVLLEPGAGFGQLSLCLSAMGYATYPVDSAVHRYQGAKDLATQLGFENCKPICATYPHYGLWPDFNILITTNIINSFWTSWDLDEDAKLKAFITDHIAIMDASRIGVHRTPDGIQAILGAAVLAGYVPTPVPIRGLSEQTIYQFILGAR